MLLPRLRIDGFQFRVAAAMGGMVVVGCLAMAMLNRHSEERIGRTFAETLVEQELQQTVREARELTDRVIRFREAMAALSADEAVGESTPRDMMLALAPRFLVEPSLSQVGYTVSTSGDYAFLHRGADDRVMLRSYETAADGTVRIFEAAVNTSGRLTAETLARGGEFDARERPIYQEAIKMERAGWIDSDGSAGDEEATASFGVPLAAPLRDSTGAVIGVVDVSLDPAALAAFGREMQRDILGHMFVIEERTDGSWRVIAHAENLAVAGARRGDLDVDSIVAGMSETKEGNFDASETIEGSVSLLALGDEDYLVSSRLHGGPQQPRWLVVAAMPMTAVRHGLGFEPRRTWIALSLVALGGLVVSWVVSVRLTRPLRRLTREVANLEGDEGEVFASTGAPVEIASLAQQFTAMARRVRGRKVALREAQRESGQRADRIRRANTAMIRGAELVARTGGEATAIFREFTRDCCDAMEVSTAAVWSFDGVTQQFRLVVGYNREEKQYFELPDFGSEAFPEYTEAMRRDGRVIVEDTRTDPRTLSLHRDRVPLTTRLALLDVGVFAAGKLNGFFSFQMIEPKRRWTTEDEILAGGMADIVALQREREARFQAEIKLHDQTRRLARQGRSIARIAEELGRSDEVERWFRPVTKLCAEALEAEFAVLRLVGTRDEGDGFERVAVYLARKNKHAPGVALRGDPSLNLIRRLRHERTIVVPDTTRDEDYRNYLNGNIDELPALTLLNTAIVSRDRIVGMLEVQESDLARNWTEDDRLFLAAVADVISLQLETIARRQAEAQMMERSQRLHRFNTALRGLATNPLIKENPDIALRELTKICAQALDVERSSVWLFREDPERIDLHNLFVRGEDRHEFVGSILREGHEPYFEALETERVLSLPHARTDARAEVFTASYFKPHDIWSLLDAPVRMRDRVVAVICVEAVGAPRTWSEDEQIFLGALTDLVSSILEAQSRNLIEMEIEASQERVRLLIQNAPLAAIDWDRKGCIRAWNPAAVRIFGYSEAEVVGKQGWFMVTERNRAFVRRTMKETLNMARARLDRLECRTKDGRTIYCNWHNTAIKDADQRINGVISLIEDVTEQVRAEQALDRSRERLRLFVEGAPLGVVDWDRSIKIIGWNRAAEQMFGYSQEEAAELPGHLLVPERDRTRMRRIWRDLARNRIGHVPQVVNLTRDGREIVCDWYSTVLRDDRGRMIGVISIIEDVTQRVTAEREIRALNAGLERRVAERTKELLQANDRLREVDRLKTEFLATMSHELRTPLNSIIGFSTILKEGMAGPLNAEQSAQIKRVHASGKHLLTLINDLLDLSKIEAGRMRLNIETFDPGEVLQELADTLQPMVMVKNLAFVVVNDVSDLRIISDRGRIYQVLVNLANNAVKFTESGQVTVRLGVEGEGVKFEVRDTGPGIPMDKRDRLFEAFRQVDGSAQRRFEGTGLGLYLSRKLVTMLGGRIGVDSETGQGSNFYFWIPQHLPESYGESTPPILPS
ncbi:PAS domain S-box protein [Synoicihabitans lomoniglobus]|uniref:histidine kinase n=1 Tax=Synoicihabitans lomoniglobus TaxID=2909285 RepID=A0AAF0CQV6_9BACT|nr:PAS domain S-box protein [Opitutaceae bacterium LMO-M01]WED66378.1 PAS domain S-box protein [Opitutaceae bacterium LMO-M01]